MDPIGVKGGVNLYIYANDNPVVFSDPNGMDPPQHPGLLRRAPTREERRELDPEQRREDQRRREQREAFERARHEGLFDSPDPRAWQAEFDRQRQAVIHPPGTRVEGREYRLYRDIRREMEIMRSGLAGSSMLFFGLGGVRNGEEYQRLLRSAEAAGSLEQALGAGALASGAQTRAAIERIEAHRPPTEVQGQLGDLNGQRLSLPRVPGQETRRATREESRMFSISVRERRERSHSTFDTGSSEQRVGTRLSVGIARGGDVTSTQHTHPSSKIALFSRRDIEAFAMGRFSPDTVHSVIGDRWPTARRVLVAEGFEPPPLSPVVTSIRQDMLTPEFFRGLDLGNYQLRIDLPYIPSR